jgi:hypothetical protein
LLDDNLYRRTALFHSPIKECVIGID